VSHVQARLGHSERRICRALGISRSAVRYEPQPRADESVLTGSIVTLAGQYGRYGYRRVHYNTIRPHSALGYRPPAPETLTPIEELPNQPIAA
jgi:transposase InsO family protein